MGILYILPFMFLAVPVVLGISFFRYRKKLSQKYFSVLPAGGLKFEGVKGWWSGHNIMDPKQFSVNMKSSGEVLFNYNRYDIYIQDDRLVIAGKAHIHLMWGSKWWLRPVVIYREQPGSVSEYEFTSHFISVELIADDLRISFWNYIYNKQMVLHIKSQQKEIQAAIAEKFLA